MAITAYQDLTVKGRDYEALYLDYWNSTGGEDGGTIVWLRCGLTSNRSCS
jgi:hypothetical protein